MEESLKNFLKENLQKNKDMNFNNIDKSKVIDYQDIIIDSNKPVLERIKDYLIQNKTGYFIKIGNRLVKFEYSDNSKLLAENCIAYALTNEFTRIS